MAKRFTRNIDNVEDITKLPLYLTLQNDLVSDDKDVYVKNGEKYEKITGKSGGYAGNVISIDFLPTDDGILAQASMYGDVTDPETTIYYNFGLMYSNGNKTGVFFKYEPSLGFSVATIHVKESDMKGREPNVLYIEVNDNSTDPQLHAFIYSKQILQVDYNETNIYSPMYIRNKPSKSVSVSFGGYSQSQRKVFIYLFNLDPNLLEVTASLADQQATLDTTSYDSETGLGNMVLKFSGTSIISGELEVIVKDTKNEYFRYYQSI